MLKVEDKRQREAPAFDAVRDQVEQFAVRKAQVDLVTKLRADAKIERLDKPAAQTARRATEEVTKTQFVPAMLRRAWRSSPHIAA